MDYNETFIHAVQQKLLDEGVEFWPETTATIMNQYHRVRAGVKACMLFHKIKEDSIPVELLSGAPANCEWIETEEGTFFYNTDKVSHRDVMNHYHKGTVGILLGYGIASVPSQVQGTFALRLMSSDGIEKECVCCTSKQIEKVTEALMDFYEKGDVIVPQTREDFRTERLSRFKHTNGEYNGKAREEKE